MNDYMNPGDEFQFEATISPEDALAIVQNTLALNANFRKPTQRSGAPNNAAATYADAMKSGRWNWRDAAPIRLTPTDMGVPVCTDGLHRLYAAHLAKVPLRCMVWAGETFAAGSESDRHTARTFVQLLISEGVHQNASQHAPTIGFLMTGALRSVTGEAASTAKRRMHFDDMWEQWQKHEAESEQWLPLARRLRSKGLGITGAHSFLIACPYRDDIAEHLDNDDFAPGDPILALLKWGSSHQLRHGVPGRPEPTWHVMCKATDAMVQGRRPDHFKNLPNPRFDWAPGGDPYDFLPARLGPEKSR